jgi:aspartyl-tRNA synthetase
MKITEEGLSGGVSKFFAEKTDEITKALDASPGDLILLVADKWSTCCTSLGAVRTRLGRDLGLSTEGFKFCWIVDFPLFEWNDDEEKWDPAHHMFTMPQDRFLETLEDDPGSVKGDLYDLVCNGLELASGSIRIHTPALQRRVFSILGITPQEAERRFGFLLKALKYGPPPHGGIAPGLDRLIMIMTGESSIKDVIAFPKNTAGVSPMDDAPAEIDAEQLNELGLSIVKSDKNEE